MADPLVLVANPGNASRKYALFKGNRERANLHFEYFTGRVICTYTADTRTESPTITFTDIREAAFHVMSIFREFGALRSDEMISRIGLRIVAPGSHFLKDNLVDENTLDKIRQINRQAPIHIAATLDELERLRAQFAETPVIGVSDSAFHITKPDSAWNYGIPLEDADRFDVKRFGYHGLSVESIIEQLKQEGSLPEKLIIAHLGSGASVTAVQSGKSIDNTMGYSPLGGLIMSTRSGSIDPAATQALKDIFSYNDTQLNTYLNLHSGLLGLGGNSDIRELLRREDAGDHRAKLALSTYIYSVQKGIGQIAAALNGADGIVFTGTVGERSSQIRARVAQNLSYLGFTLDNARNSSHIEARQPAIISSAESQNPIIVVPAHENIQIAKHAIEYQL